MGYCEARVPTGVLRTLLGQYDETAIEGFFAGFELSSWGKRKTDGCVYVEQDETCTYRIIEKDLSVEVMVPPEKCREDAFKCVVENITAANLKQYARVCADTNFFKKRREIIKNKQLLQASAATGKS